MNEQTFHQRQRCIQRRARVVNNVPQDDVILRKLAFHRNGAQHRIQHILLLGKIFNLALGNLRRVEHRQRHQFRGIADQDGPVFLAAAHRQRDAAFDVELRYSL